MYAKLRWNWVGGWIVAHIKTKARSFPVAPSKVCNWRTREKGFLLQMWKYSSYSQGSGEKNFNVLLSTTRRKAGPYSWGPPRAVLLPREILFWNHRVILSREDLRDYSSPTQSRASIAQVTQGLSARICSTCKDGNATTSMGNLPQSSAEQNPALRENQWRLKSCVCRMTLKKASDPSSLPFLIGMMGGI